MSDLIIQLGKTALRVCDEGLLVASVPTALEEIVAQGNTRATRRQLYAYLQEYPGNVAAAKQLAQWERARGKKGYLALQRGLSGAPPSRRGELYASILAYAFEDEDIDRAAQTIARTKEEGLYAVVSPTIDAHVKGVLREAEDQYASGKPKTARKTARKVFAYDPGNNDAQYFVGYAFFRDARTAEKQRETPNWRLPLKSLKRSLEEEPTLRRQQWAHARLAQCYAKLGRVELAREHAQEAQQAYTSRGETGIFPTVRKLL